MCPVQSVTYLSGRSSRVSVWFLLRQTAFLSIFVNPGPRIGAEEPLFHQPCCLRLHPTERVRIGGESEGRCVVSKPLLDDLRIHSRPEHVRGVAMSQVVEADPGESDPFYDPSEVSLNNVVSMKRSAVWLAEDEPLVFILPAQCLSYHRLGAPEVFQCIQ